MKAAILGANSYIARNMILLNSHSTFAEMTLYDYQAEHLDGAENYRRLDPANQGEMESAIEACDLIYFFIGKVGTLKGFDEAGTFVDVNEKYLLNLLNAYRKVKSHAKILFPSTRLVYKGSEEKLDENAEKTFLTPYALQKYACEQYLAMYSRLFGIRYCVLRICVPYGTLVHPVSSYGTLDFFMKQAADRGVVSLYGSGEQRRTFTYIGDLCRTLWLAGLNDACINDVYNVGGEDSSLGAIAELVAEKTSTRVAHEKWPDAAWSIESGSTVFDSRKLDKILGARVSTSVSQWAEERVFMKKGSGNGMRERERERERTKSKETKRSARPSACSVVFPRLLHISRDAGDGLRRAA